MMYSDYLRDLTIMNSTSEYIPAKLARRIGAIAYDSAIAFAILFFATALALLLNKGQSLLPYRVIFLSYLIGISGCYFVWSWRKSQSLGMMAWKLVIRDQHNQPITRLRAWCRFLVALAGMYCFGLTLIWCLIDSQHQSLHDKICGTKLLRFAPNR